MFQQMNAARQAVQNRNSVSPGGWSGALQMISPLALTMAQGIRSGQGAAAMMPLGVEMMRANQERMKEKAADEKLNEMLGQFGLSPSEQALLGTMDLKGKQSYLAQLIASRRAGRGGGGGGSAIDPELWKSIMGGNAAPQGGAGMLSMGSTAPIAPVAEAGGLSFGAPEVAANSPMAQTMLPMGGSLMMGAPPTAPIQGASGMMGQPMPQPPSEALSFGQIEQKSPQVIDPMKEVLGIEARMKRALMLPPSKTRDAVLSTLNAQHELALARAERAAPAAVPATFDVLERRAAAAGLRPGTPEYQQFMLQGGRQPEALSFEVGPDGSVSFNTGTGSNALPKTTEGEKSASGYLSRMKSAEATLDNLAQEGTAVRSISSLLAGGSDFEGLFLNDQQQKILQAQRDWVRAKLRKESGAVIGPEEMAEEIRTYFPLPGEGPEVVEQKRRSRLQAERQMEIMAGNAAAQAQPTGGKKRQITLDMIQGSTAPDFVSDEDKELWDYMDPIDRRVILESYQ